MFSAGFEDRFHRALADVLHAAETEPDGISGFIAERGETPLARIDVGRPNLDAMLSRVAIKRVPS